MTASTPEQATRISARRGRQAQALAGRALGIVVSRHDDDPFRSHTRLLGLTVAVPACFNATALTATVARGLATHWDNPTRYRMLR